MIFAAGFGTRLGSRVKDTPKPLLRVGNTTLLDHAIKITRQAGIENIIVNAHYLGYKIEAHLSSNPSIKVVVEEPEILDTGGGLLNALPHLGHEPVFTLNADNYWFGQNPLLMLAQSWEPEDMDALLLLGSKKNTYGYLGKGDFVIDSHANLTRRGEDNNGQVYLGAQIIKPSLIGHDFGKVFSLNLIWDQLIHNKKIKGLFYNGQWAVIDTPYGIETIQKIL